MRLMWPLVVTILFALHKANQAEPIDQSNTQNVDLEQYTSELIAKLLPANYNKNLRPNYGGEPIRVNISIYINDISAISESTMDFKVDFLIRHFWRDRRLAFPVKHNISRLTLGEEFMKNIWKPDSYFGNGKEINVHKTVSSESSTLFRIHSNGDILHSTRISLLAQCPMNLRFFPMDQQKCSIEITSYGHAINELELQWVNGSIAIEISPNINLPTFQLVGYNKLSVFENYFSGTYSRLQCDLFLSRSIGYYLSQVYIPAMLVVIISWLPFWLDRNDHHARVALGVTTVLTMTTLTTNTNSDFPKISYLKAIDIYLFVSFLMVFLSLIEYATVGYYENERTSEHKEKDTPKKNLKEPDNFRYDAEGPKNIKLVQIFRQRRSRNNCNKECESEKLSELEEPYSEPNIEQTEHIHSHIHKPLIRDTSIIDQWARWAFPMSFLVFNIIYTCALCLLVSIYSSHQDIEFKLNK